jgi:hypothetical protein
LSKDQSLTTFGEWMEGCWGEGGRKCNNSSDTWRRSFHNLSKR